MACLFGHKWNGCKCEKCGKERDEQHDWNGCKCKKCEKSRDENHIFIINPGKCEKKCSICGDTRDSHNLNGNICQHCGKTIWFTEEEWTIIRPIDGLIFLRGKMDTGIGNASFINTISRFRDEDNADDAIAIIKTVNIFKDIICGDDPQTAFLFGNNRKQICDNLLKRYKDYITEISV